VGGSILFFPTSTSDQSLSKDSKSPNLNFPFTYEHKEAPNKERQDTSHPHQIVEGEGGVLYVPDLGSDRIWLVKREGESELQITGYLQAPPGAGPRHVCLTQDGT
jgi:6-phosphogluconolactonase (cycloisomerase 2 family)